MDVCYNKFMKIFVYGTLRKGLGNHDYLKGAKFIQKAVLKDHIIYVSGLPFLTFSQGKECVGEIYEVSSEQLSLIDSLEGHPNWYKRSDISSHLDIEDRVEAYLMEKNQIDADATEVKDYYELSRVS